MVRYGYVTYPQRMYTHALRVNTRSAPHIRCATGSCITYRRFPSSVRLRGSTGRAVEAVPTAGQSHEVEWKLAGGGGWLRVLAMDDAPAGGIVCVCNGSFLSPDSHGVCEACWRRQSRESFLTPVEAYRREPCCPFVILESCMRSASVLYVSSFMSQTYITVLVIIIKTWWEICSYGQLK
jgi:hypothetical protein